MAITEKKLPYNAREKNEYIDIFSKTFFNFAKLFVIMSMKTKNVYAGNSKQKMKPGGLLRIMQLLALLGKNDLEL